MADFRIDTSDPNPSGYMVRVESGSVTHVAVEQVQAGTLVQVTSGSSMNVTVTQMQPTGYIMIETAEGVKGIRTASLSGAGDLIISLLDGTVINAGNVSSAGGMAALIDDPNPTLGGKLVLNSYQVSGSLSTNELILDGGLL